MLERQKYHKEKVEKNRQQITDTEQKYQKSTIRLSSTIKKRNGQALEQKRSELCTDYSERETMQWSGTREGHQILTISAGNMDSYLEKHDTLEKNRKEKTKYEDNKSRRRIYWKSTVTAEDTGKQTAGIKSTD